MLPFQERGRDTKDQGSKVTDLLFAKLAADPALMLVDREDIQKVLDEQELNLSGLVNPQQATKVGQLTGAKLLITGSVLQVDNSVYLVAKIIGTETSRVRRCLGQGQRPRRPGQAGRGPEQGDRQDGGQAGRRPGGQARLARGSHRRVEEEARRRQAARRERARSPSSTRSTLVLILIDPAAEDRDRGCSARRPASRLIDPKEGSKKDVDIRIEGEALSEFAVRHGNLDLGQGPGRGEGRSTRPPARSWPSIGRPPSRST